MLSPCNTVPLFSCTRNTRFFNRDNQGQPHASLTYPLNFMCAAFQNTIPGAIIAIPYEEQVGNATGRQQRPQPASQPKPIATKSPPEFARSKKERVAVALPVPRQTRNLHIYIYICIQIFSFAPESSSGRSRRSRMSRGRGCWRGGRHGMPTGHV